MPLPARRPMNVALPNMLYIQDHRFALQTDLTALVNGQPNKTQDMLVHLLGTDAIRCVQLVKCPCSRR